MHTSALKYSTVLLLIVFSILSLRGTGQEFTAIYNFANVTMTSGRTDPTPVPVVEGLIFSSFQAVGPAGTPSNNPNAGGRFSFTGWPLGATNGSDIFTGTIRTDQYYEVSITPQVNYRLSLDSITFTLQRSGTGIRQYAVRSGMDNFAANLPAEIAPANGNLQVVGDNIFQVTDPVTTAQDGSRIILTGVTDLSGSITFRLYGWNAEASGGTFSIDNVKFSGKTSLVAGSASLSVSTSSISFPSTNIQTSSNALSYTVQGENLSGPLNITTSAPYTVSVLENSGYTNSLVIPAADIITQKTIYVKFSPLTTGRYNDTILNSTSGAAPVKVALAGEGIDPANLSFDFNNCLVADAPGSGFVSYSVTGAEKWACSNFGINNTKGVDVNGFSGGAQENEDWLISPPLLIGALQLPVLSFWSRGEFSGPTLQLLISTDYSGSGNPNNATWTEIQANFPSLNNTWTFTDGVNLTAYKNNPAIFIAFRYTASAELGAARWTMDNISVTDRSTLLSVSPSGLNFGEVIAGSHSPGLPINLQVIGYSDITLTAPESYALSADSNTFSNQLLISQSVAESGTSVFVRFSPSTKEIKKTGTIRFTGNGLDSNAVLLTGSSYPTSETFDVSAYNLSFFGSNPNNNPTPQKIETQVNNISTVFGRMNMDVVGIEEMSNDDALTSLLQVMSGYAAVVSNRWSYSFEPPDPAFPPQKIGFIYKTATMSLVEQRVMFEGLYDSVRTGLSHVLDDYPTGLPSSFWASGRLPFMATFDANINGVNRRIRLIVIHGKSASDMESYNRRLYDVKVLKDTLDAYYSNDNVILLGDFNDRLSGSIFVGSTSPYKPFIDDSLNYAALTLPLDQAGKVSFLSGTGLIDHIIISNELKNVYISNSTDIEDPRLYISGYNATTASDHLPVFTRFNLSNVAMPVHITKFSARRNQKHVLLTWTTAMEFNNSHFIIERSQDGRKFIEIARIKSAGNRNTLTNYQSIDSLASGINYYRLKQVDLDGQVTISKVVFVNMGSIKNRRLYIYPNPVSGKIELDLDSPAKSYVAKVIGADGRSWMQASGDLNRVTQQLNGSIARLEAGIYILQIVNSVEHHAVKFIKQ